MREVWKVTALSVYPEYSGGYKTVVAAKTVPKGVNSLCLSFKKKKKMQPGLSLRNYEYQ